MKIQTRITCLLVILAVVFIGWFFALKNFEQSRLEIFQKEQGQAKKDIFEQILYMKSASIDGMSKDYSIWDEMVDFVSTGDKEWAKSNVDGGLENFKASAFWIYNLENQLVYALDDHEGPVFGEFPGAPRNVSEIFAGQPFVDFFVNTKLGLMEVQGATINNIADPKREHPKGYFLIGRLWDQKIIDDIENASGMRVEIVSEGQDASDAQLKKNGIGEIIFTHTLEGVDKKPVARLRVLFHSDSILRAWRISKNYFSFVVVFLLLGLVVVSLSLILWISWPLRKISLALSEENAQHIDSIENAQSEMGDIARLIKKFFHQKRELSSEVQERKLAVENLEQAHRDLKMMQDQLVQSEKLASIGQLAAGVAHEINNPVGFISNNMEILEQYVGDYIKVLKVAEDLRKSVAEGNAQKTVSIAEEMSKLEEEIQLDYVIKDSSKLLEHNHSGLERIKKIVLDLRTFARDEADVVSAVKIEDVIDQVLSILDNELKYKVELKKNYTDTPPVKCNAQRMGQVFINLFLNAAQAIEEKGTIEVKTYTQGKYVYVDVIDSGKGIPPENLTKIFDPFFTTKPVGQGTGLGLSVSHEFVKKHGGEITVRSMVGKGTTFTVKLPSV